MMAIFAQAAPAPTLEERQLGLLCPLLGQPTCGLQCQLTKQISGQCRPDRVCVCADNEPPLGGGLKKE
ncbi:hypothetical protein MBLNU230_g8067t1 [Neophaeotheca triangularis]